MLNQKSKKKIMSNNKKPLFISYSLALLTLAVLFTSCKDITGQGTSDAAVESTILARYLENTGNYINSAQAPAIMTAGELHTFLDSNILIIDLRSPEQFAAGHIEGAINRDPSGIMDYFDHKIDASAFDRIIFVCGMGQLSAYTSGLMRLAGYDNTYSVRYGLSAWNRTMAVQGWDLVPGSSLEDELEQTSNPKNKPGKLPEIQTGYTDGYRIARAQISKLLELPKQHFLLTYEDIMAEPSKYYLINYWPEEQYRLYGHLPGAVQYSPKKSLGLNTELFTLPTDKPIVVYCNNGHHSAHVAGFLRLLGYDAYSLQYGANAFMAEIMKKHEKKLHTYWNESNRNDFHLDKRAINNSVEETSPVEVKSVAGGC
jgi:rhodanese-related sulfurtransferase